MTSLQIITLCSRKLKYALITSRSSASGLHSETSAKERDTDMRKLISLAAALAAAGALTIGASANGGVVGGVVDAGEDIVNGVVDAGEDIVDGVTGNGNGMNGTTSGTNGTAGTTTGGADSGTAGTTGANGANGSTTGTAGTTGTANGTNGTAPGNPDTGVSLSMAAVGAAALGLAGVALSSRRNG